MIAAQRFARLSVALFLAVSAVFAARGSAVAEEGANEVSPERLEAMLEAGEFAAALESARLDRSPERRDEMLAAIATAQSRAGLRKAALATAGEVYGDVARADLLDELASRPSGGSGGGVEPDFEGLIELITGTIQPNTWDAVGGPGAIDAFAGGVYVDPRGTLRQVVRAEKRGLLDELRRANEAASGRRDIFHASPLRKISLPRLEKQVQLAIAAGRRPDEATQCLAGLERIEYVFVYPDTGDLVIAGPAGEWRTDAEGRFVRRDNGRPVVRLEDLVVVFRHVAAADDARFGCSIAPTQDALAKAQAFLKKSQAAPIKPHQRGAWLEELRGSMGLQEIEVYGLDPRTRPARIMVEADYRMKLVGMGLEEGAHGVKSYLDSIEVAPGEAPPPMDVLRWWFTLNYKALLASRDHRAFQLRGPGAMVMSENELLTKQGKRIHTGKSDELNQRFAHAFTEHFERLAEKYPVYAELRNIFDLALVAALVREEDLAGQADWRMTCFGPEGNYPVALGPAPSAVETVVNHRVIHGKHIVAGVSGGVSVRPAPLVERSAMKTDTYGATDGARNTSAAPRDLPGDVWWWD